MKSVLLIGQSNMAGRGFLHEVKPIYNENILMLRNGRWQMMAEPIHFDRSVAGIGPAASFAQAWCNANKNEQVGLIPCAEGLLMNGMLKELYFVMQLVRRSLLWKLAT